jgi:hypothetical protein
MEETVRVKNIYLIDEINQGELCNANLTLNFLLKT